MVVDADFNLNTADFSEKRALPPMTKLSNVFPELPIEERLHIVVGRSADVSEDGEQEPFLPKKRPRSSGDQKVSSRVWQHLEEEEWKEFHRDWWGESGQEKINDALHTKVLHIKQLPVIQQFGLLAHTVGELYCRGEVNQTYLDLERAHELQQQRKVLSGVLLTGQPGLGKSTDLMHIITKRMSLRRNTLFTSSANEVFWISEDGIHLCSERAHIISYASLRLLGLDSNPWSIIDASPRGALPPSRFVYSHPFFAIYAASPNIGRYKDWLKEEEPTVYIMQPWDWEEEELLQCMQLFTDLNVSPINSDNISDIRHHCGPLPRAIWSYIRDENSFKASVERAANALTVDAIYTVLSGLETLSTSDSDLASHKLLIVRRKFRNPNASLGDTYEVDFISPFAEELLRARFAFLALSDASRLFRACSLVPEASVFGGWIFEAQAMKYTAGQVVIDNDDAFGPFVRMKADVDGFKFTDDTLSSNTTTFRLEKDSSHGGVVKLFKGSSLILRFNPSDFTNYNQPLRFMDGRRPDLFHTREFLHYSDINSVAIRPECYYVPTQSNNPLFDAFFFDNSDNKHFYIYVLQMTIAKRHGGSKSGLQLVQRLKKRVILGKYAQDREIKVRYLLVAPARTHAVSWIMPEEWSDSDVRGEVYIQYLDMNVMKGKLVPAEAT